MLENIVSYLKNNISQQLIPPCESVQIYKLWKKNPLLLSKAFGNLPAVV